MSGLVASAFPAESAGGPWALVFSNKHRVTTLSVLRILNDII